MRDENSGECFGISRRDSTGYVLIEFVPAGHWAVPKRCVLSLQKERRFSQPEQRTSPFRLTSVCVPSFEPVGNAFSLFPGTVVDSSSPEGTGWREEGQGDSLTVASRDPHSSKTCSGASVLCEHSLGSLQSDLSSPGGHQGQMRGLRPN